MPDCDSYPSTIPKNGSLGQLDACDARCPYASRAGRLWALNGLSLPASRRTHCLRTGLWHARPASWRNAVATEYLSIGGVFVLGALAFGAFRKGAGQRARLFGASWFLLTYLPISNLFDLNATVAEHWLYLPSVGLCIFLAGVLFDLPMRYLRSTVAVACVAVAGLSARSAIRSSDWVDPETFFRRTFAAGGSSSRIGVNLGGHLRAAR